MWRLVILLFAVVAGMPFMFGTAHAGLSFQPGRTPDGISYLLVEGEFDYEDDLRSFFRHANSVDVVLFDSAGGNIQKAMELGRAIRSQGLNTIQPRGLECASACALAFMGGIKRLAEPGSIGVHRSSFRGALTIDPNDAVAQIQAVTAQVIGYMVEMGVDPALLELALQYDSTDIRYLSGSEMRHYRVTLEEAQVASVPSAVKQHPARTEPNVRVLIPSSLPAAKSGVIRHPKGSVKLMQRPDAKSKAIATLQNRTAVRIWSETDRWYRVRVGLRLGYLHHSWVLVDQYEGGAFEERHVQIKSFSGIAEAESFLRGSDLPLAAYVATNGWLAITLAETYLPSEAGEIVRLLKAQGAIPEDSFVTFGNTYVHKVCCSAVN